MHSLYVRYIQGGRQVVDGLSTVLCVDASSVDARW